MKGLIAAAIVATAGAAEYRKGTCGGGSKWSYDLWAPESEGSYPIMLCVTGIEGLVPGSSYSGLATAMANKGVVVVMLSRFAFPLPERAASFESKALDWLEGSVSQFGLKATADFSQLIIAGHSAGAHVLCNLLVDSCANAKAKAVVMMDPVDGIDPFGIMRSYCTTPGQKLSFAAPALLLRTGLDPRVRAVVACAPDRISNQRFFNAWSGPIWMVNATEYAHLDVNDEGIASLGGWICASDDKPKDVYHEHVAEMVDAFISLVLRSNASAEDRLVDAVSMKVKAEVLRDYNGHSQPFTPGCSTRASVLV